MLSTACFLEKENPAYYEMQKKASKLTIVIIRDNGHHSHFQSSQPCVQCQEMLKRLKFKKIIYTTDNGGIEIKRPHQLNSTHCSRAQRVTMEVTQNTKSGNTYKPNNTISPKKKDKSKEKKKKKGYYKNISTMS